MSNPSKAKGTAWESALVGYLLGRGLEARRKVQTGRKDEGDIAIQDFPWLVLEAKNEKAIRLAAYVDQANAEATHAGAEVGVAVVKRRGVASPGSAYAVMDLDTLLKILDRTYPF